MRIESERIKKTMREVCQKEKNVKPYDLMCKILDYLHTHENMTPDLRDDNVKELIDEAEGEE
jgi:hypothetical protein